MRQLKLQDRANKDWSKQFVDNNHYEELLTEDTFVTKPDGEPLCVLLKNVISTEVNAQAWSVLKKYNAKTEARGVATGIDLAPRKKMDGTYSKVLRAPRGWEVASGVVGYFERTARFPYAHACSWNQDHPEKFEQLLPLAQRVNDLFKEHLPARWEAQKSFADKTDPNWIINGTVFSTLTINKNFRTSCHKDAGDLHEGFGCLSIITEGPMSGGKLVFPDFKVAAELRTGDLILFDPHEFHGNTQIIRLQKRAQRCTIVYYLREKIQYCLSPKEELERAKRRKPGQPLFD